MESNRWDLAPRPNLQRNGRPTTRIYWSVAASGIDRIRRRWLRAHASPPSQPMGYPTMEDGTARQDPSDDGMIPAAPQGTLFLYSPLGSVDSALETQRTHTKAILG